HEKGTHAVGAPRSFRGPPRSAPPPPGSRTDLQPKGSVKSIKGAPIASPHVSAKVLKTGSVKGEPRAPNESSILNLPSGAYEISITAEGFGTRTLNVTVPQ